MELFGRTINFTFSKKVEPQVEAPKTEVAEQSKPQPKAEFGGWSGGGWGAVTTMIYGGEKTLGAMGPATRNVLDHNTLGIRAWELDLNNETCHTAIKESSRWILGTGLRLDSEPQIDVLKMYGITLDSEKFNEQTEPLWKVFASARVADYANRESLHKVAKKALKNSKVRGDVLVILRVNKAGIVKVQLIDGQHVQTPVGLAYVGSYDKMVDNSIGYDFVWTNGNIIRWGVEIDDTGEHVAYHIRTGVGLTYERIPARGGKSNSLMAYMVYGGEYRLDNLRGIPSVTPNMEGAKQLDAYTAATVEGAVERAKIAWYAYHEKGTEEKSPIEDNFLAAAGYDNDLQTTNNGVELARNVASTYNKMLLNPSAGTDIKAVESKQEIQYAEFFKTRQNSTFATFGIPPEVATMLYGGSYSASRAATNGFQYSLNIDREDFGAQFYQPIYNLQLDIWVLQGLVQAPGYLSALLSENEIILAAYRFANWEGDPVPQIDELKEVQAARLKLGTGFAHIPFSTAQKVTQNLGEGNFKANLAQSAKELDETDSAGIEPLKEFPDPVEGEGNEAKPKPKPKVK